MESVREEPAMPRDEATLPTENPSKSMSIVAIALVACIATWHGWRPGFVFVPTDALRLVAPWGDPKRDYIARNEGLLDQAVQFVPWTLYAVDRLKKREIPLWNPYAQIGAPFLANGQSAIFYPTMLLHLLLSPTWSWTIAAALKLFSAGLGTWFLAGRYGLRGWPRLLSAIVFMLCGFNVVWLNHPQTNVSALLPWAVLAVEAMVDRITLQRILGSTLIFAIQFLGGHPGTTIHLLLTCGLVWLLRIALSKQRRSCAWPAGAALFVSIVFGFALAAAQWLPLMEYAAHSGAKIVREEKIASASFFETNPKYFIGMIFPYACGFPDGVSPFEIRKATMLPNTNELVPGWVGTIPLLLAIFGAIALRRNGTVRLWTIIALLAAAIAISFPLIDNLVRQIPGLRMTTNPRMLLATALALAILAGFGLEELMRRSSYGFNPARLRTIMFIFAALAAAMSITCATVLLVAKTRIRNIGYEHAREEYEDTTMAHEHTLAQVRSMVDRVHVELILMSLRLLIPAAMLAAGAFFLKHRNGQKLAAGMCGLALIDLLAFAIPYNPGSPRETYFPTNLAAIQKLQSLPEARIAGTFRTLMPETSTAYHLADLRGYDALGPHRYYQWWEHPGIGELDEYWFGYLLQLRNPQHPAWSLLNFGYVVSALDQPPPSAEKFELLSRGPDAAIYRAKKIRPRAWIAPMVEKYNDAEQVLDRVAKMDFDPNQTVLVDREIEDRINAALVAEHEQHIHSNQSGFASHTAELLSQARPEVVSVLVNHGGGWLILADSYFPGWTATILNQNGQETPAPIYPAYGVMRAVPLPPHDDAFIVEFRYRPQSWRIGSLTSASAWALFAILSMGSLVMRGLRLRRG